MKAILGSGKHHHVVRASIFLLLTAALVWAMIGCTEILEDYELTVSSTGGGSVTDPGERTLFVPKGAVILLKVQPDDGYRFVGWTGDVRRRIHDVESPQTVITIKGDYSITAEFAKIVDCRLTVSASAAGGGRVTAPREPVPTYDSGDWVNLKAEAQRGFEFVNWTGDVGNVVDVNAPDTRVEMESNYSITANFEAEAAVNITDPNLEAAIREEATDIPEGPIYASDLDGLTYLDAEGKNITDLTGLEYCTDLEELYLSRNQISDISPVASLTRLEELSLGGNQIYDISPLAELSKLTLLNLSYNPISDIQALVNYAWLDKGDKVYLYNYDALSYTRPSDSDVSTSIAQLQERGVIVEY